MVCAKGAEMSYRAPAGTNRKKLPLSEKTIWTGNFWEIMDLRERLTVVNNVANLEESWEILIKYERVLKVVILNKFGRILQSLVEDFERL